MIRILAIASLTISLVVAASSPAATCSRESLSILGPLAINELMRPELCKLVATLEVDIPPVRTRPESPLAVLYCFETMLDGVPTYVTWYLPLAVDQDQ